MVVMGGHRSWRVGGPLYIAAFIASLAAGAALAKTSLFLPGASGAELRAYLA